MLVEERANAAVSSGILRQRQTTYDCDSPTSPLPPLCPDDGRDAHPRVTNSHIDDLPDGDVSRFMKMKLHARCWLLFVAVSVTLLAVTGMAVVMVAWRRRPPNTGQSGKDGVEESDDGLSRHHSLEYFVLCIVGGILSGIPHVLITPVDVVKCRMQIGEVASISSGLRMLLSEGCLRGEEVARSSANVGWNDRGGHTAAVMRWMHKSILRAKICKAILSVLFKGWLPTLIGYCLQGAFKFGFYEYFKFRYAMMLPYDVLVQHVVLVFIVASASAELIADIALAPWETVKVRIQTGKSSMVKAGCELGEEEGGVCTLVATPSLRDIMPSIYFAEGIRGFYRCLVPLWCRQVPYTVVKFTTFEQCARLIVYAIHRGEANIGPQSSMERLVVALSAGYIAGTLCAVVSQPADVVVSRLSNADGRGTVRAIIHELGWWGLWRGLSARVMMVGTLSGAQWAIYDGFKTLAGASGV